MDDQQSNIDTSKSVCISSRDSLHWVSEREKPVKLDYKIKRWGNWYMAYVEAKRKDKSWNHTFHGNSLWGIGALPLKDLLNRIDSYEWFDQIKKDFGC